MLEAIVVAPMRAPSLLGGRSEKGHLYRFPKDAERCVLLGFFCFGFQFKFQCQRSLEFRTGRLFRIVKS